MPALNGNIAPQRQLHSMVMTTKALFFDIDGTLISFNTHRIPQSTVQALEAAKAGGVKVFISTGRPMPFIFHLDEIEHLIDGYITTNGGYCFIGKKPVYYHPIAKPDACTLIDYCLKVDCSAFVVGKETIALVNHKPVVDEVFGSILDVDDFGCDTIDNVMQQDTLQITAFLSQEQENEIMPHVQGCIGGRWSPAFVDINNVLADKGRGMLAMAAHCGIAASETMAFGDGGNDIPILRQAGIGVAMGNAAPSVKAAADFVTTSVDDNGIANALKHFNII